MNLEELELKLDIEHDFELLVVREQSHRVMMSFRCVNRRKVIMQHILTEWTRLKTLIFEQHLICQCDLKYQDAIVNTVKDFVNPQSASALMTSQQITQTQTTNDPLGLIRCMANTFMTSLSDPDRLTTNCRTNFVHLLDQPVAKLPEPNYGILGITLQLNETINNYLQRVENYMREQPLEAYQQLIKPTQCCYDRLILLLVMDREMDISVFDILNTFESKEAKSLSDTCKIS